MIRPPPRSTRPAPLCPYSTLFRSILLSFAVLLLAGCATVGPNADATAWNDARQLVLVTTADWEATTGTLRTFDRGDDGAWHEAGKAAPVSIGRGGDRKSTRLNSSH